jgi:hypothetical protein
MAAAALLGANDKQPPHHIVLMGILNLSVNLASFPGLPL